MSNIISDVVSKLSVITGQTTIDWDAFDSVLKKLEDINVYDAQCEETILSELMLEGDFHGRGMVLADIIRHFLSCGYDVSANGGLNGGLALEALCWASYDQYILDAAKVLMNAGAPVRYRTSDDDPDDGTDGLLGSIGFKLSGAWEIDEDFAFANVLEAYYAMTEANMEGKDYNSIENYASCMGKPLTAVSVTHIDGKVVLQKEKTGWIYSEPLILWFEDKPLVVSCYTDFVVNPVYTDDKKDALADVTAAFSSLVGASLQKIEYTSAVDCCLAFSNGEQLLFASRDIGDGNRLGTFDIRMCSTKPSTKYSSEGRMVE